MISNRASSLLNNNNPAAKAFNLCLADPFSTTKNPNGYLNLGIAENHLMEDESLQKIGNCSPLYPKLLHYNRPQGMPKLASSYAGFLNKFFKIENIKEDNIVMSTGLSAMLEMISYAHLNHEDEILSIAPIFNGFYFCLQYRFGTKLKSSHAFNGDGSLNLKTLENDIKNSKKVKSLLITNPHNPTGYIHTENEIREIIKLAKKYKLSIIADEIYAFSNYSTTPFISFLDPRFDDLKYRESIIHLYGLAKDFALSGMKVGALYCENDDLSKAMAGLAYFHTVSTQTQHLANSLFEDHQFCQEFFASSIHKIKVNASYLRIELKKIGIESLPSKAGIFTMINLSDYLPEKSAEGEMNLFNDLLEKLKINITPGQIYDHNEYGWFRVCFAKDLIEIQEFIKRLKHLGSQQNGQ